MKRQHIGHTDAVAYPKKSKRSDADGTETPCRFLHIPFSYLHIKRSKYMQITYIAERFSF